MYDKICKVCGKPFHAANPRYLVCSAECRKIYQTRYKQIYAETHPDYVIRQRLRKYRRAVHIYKPIEKPCALCGEILPDGRQKYCLRCLISEFISKGGKAGSPAYRILLMRGYANKEDILMEARAINLI